METLKTSFRKNGINYRMIDRTDKVALFELSLETDPRKHEIAGYEVARIKIRKANIFHGVSYPDREEIPSDEAFGSEGSKTLFPADLNYAKKYLTELTDKLNSPVTPDP